MKSKISGIITVAGLVGVMYYGYQYLQNSDSFEVFGADVAVSTGDITPVIISAVVMVAGIVISRFNFK